MNKISVIIPVYNEAKNIKVFLDRLVKTLEKITQQYEIIFSIDPSKDDSEKIIKSEAEKNKKIKMLVFSRRFGQPAATMAGLKFSNSERCMIIDCDLQDPPELLLEMYNKMNEGYDVILAKRRSRKGETLIKKIIASLGYNLINKISDVKIPENSGDFRLLSKKVIDKLKLFEEPNAFLRGLVAYVGYKQTSIEYDRDERFEGAGKYNKYFGSIKIAFNGVFGFSSKPIQLILIMGLVLLFSSFIYGFYLFFSITLGSKNYDTHLLTNFILIFLFGFQFVGLGIIGEYLTRIYDEVKKRPNFIIDKKINFDE